MADNTAQKTVVIADYDFGDAEIERAIIEGAGLGLATAQCKTEDDVIAVARNADAIIAQYATVGAKAIGALTRCEVIARYGTGTDIVDVDAATRHGILVTNVPNEWCENEVADHAMTLLLAAARKVCRYNQAAQDGVWRWQTGEPIHRISGRTLGLLSFGAIAQAVGRRAAGFGLRVIASDPYMPAADMIDRGAVPVSLDELLDQSDYLVIQAPLTKETYHLIGEPALRRMKSTAFLINTARGPIVNDQALYRALSEGWIAGAGLDDIEEEPAKQRDWTPDNPLFGLDNVIITPHAAYYSEEAIHTVRHFAASEVVRVLTGQLPLSPVNATQMASTRREETRGLMATSREPVELREPIEPRGSAELLESAEVRESGKVREPAEPRESAGLPEPAGLPESAGLPEPAGLPDLRATADERRASGRAARRRVPRSALASWAEEDRGHDPLETILAQNKIRVAELVPIRHSRMAASAWNYYRGAAAVMAADLASRPNSGLTVQLCGDAHVLNFGLWATPERNLSFDLRDFDETLPGPFEWDVKRFAASLVVAARDNGLKPARAAAAVTAGVGAYCRRMRTYTTMPELDIWYDGTRVDSLIDYFEPADRGRVSVHIEKKRERRTSRGAFAKLTNMVNGRPRITEDPPIRVTISDAEQAELVGQLLAGYRLTLQEDRRTLFDRFTETDTVRQVVGVGSVGMRVYLVLLEGRSGADPLFLQVKQAGPSVYEAHTESSRHRTHGARVISGKRLIQSATDIFVGWGSMDGNDYYVRQFRDMKIIPTTALIAPRLIEFATACGETLARAHARTGDPLAIAAYIGKGPKFTAAIGRFADLYADQTERDHAQLVRAIDTGAVESRPG